MVHKLGLGVRVTIRVNPKKGGGTGGKILSHSLIVKKLNNRKSFSISKSMLYFLNNS